MAYLTPPYGLICIKSNVYVNNAILFLILLFLLPACVRHKSVPEEEEEAIYLLVGEPCSEGDYATAIARADSILASPREMSDTLRAYIMIDRDVAISEYGHLDWGARYADTLIDFGRRTGVMLAVMQGLQNRGVISRRQGNYDNAISDYKEGMEIAVAESDIEMQQVFAEMLAIACSENNLNEEALSFARRSLDLSKQMEDPEAEMNSIATIGGILVKTGQYVKTIEQLEPYHDRVSQFRNVIRVKYLTPLLKSYLQLDSLKRVRQTLAETYEALEGVPRNTQIYLVAVNAEACLAEKEGRYDDEWRWLQVADTIGGMGISPEMWYGQRASCLAHMGRFAEAYEMELKAFAALDSLRNGQIDSRLAELSVKYDTLNKTNEIVRLKAQRLLWGLLTLGCVLVLLVLVFLIVVLRGRARRRLAIARQEEYLNGLEQERQRMARELHDGIAGSLVGLQCQVRVLSPADMERRMIKIIGRVRQLSHELMPPEFSEKKFSVMLNDYVSQQNQPDGRKLIILTDNGAFDWDSLSPEDSHELYRMLQEAVSNALRHGGDGDICIELGRGDGYEITVTNPLPEHKTEENGDGAGLRSLRIRAAIIGATLSVKEENGMFVLKIIQNK